MTIKFRFQDLKIWQLAIQIANELFDIADELEKKRFRRYALCALPHAIYSMPFALCSLQEVLK